MIFGVISFSAYTQNLAENPVVTCTPTSTSCLNSFDGSLHFLFAGGESGQDYDVNLHAGSGYSDDMPPATPSLGNLVFSGDIINELTVSNLAGGDYTLVLKPAGTPGLGNYYYSYNVPSPTAVEINILAPEAACLGSSITVTSNVNGGVEDGIKTYQWQESFDNDLYTDIAGKIYPSLDLIVNSDIYLKVVVKNNGNCPAESDAFLVKGLQTPEIVSKLSNPAIPDTACFYYDLNELPIMEVAGVPEYNITWHYNKPLSAIDNRYLIRKTDSIVSRGQKTPFEFGEEGIIWTRMSVKDLCYDIIPIVIRTSDIDLCSPIVVPSFFSPDGDNIYNRLYIKGLEEYSDPQISIYDRYGKIVFEGKKQNFVYPNGWDGVYLGKPLPSDEYWYVIRIKETKNKVGHFSLKRRK